MSKPVIIIDGMHLAYRVGHVFKNLTIVRDGEEVPTGVYFGFFRNVLYLREKFKDALICVAWDRKPTERLKINANYKANRPKTEVGHTVFSTIDVLKIALSACGVVNVDLVGEEADDVAATLVSKYYTDCNCYLYSGDNDYLQLVTKDGRVKVIKPANGKDHPEKLCDWDWVVAEWETTPIQLPLLRAMIGDTSDNLPGIPRFPRKLAAALSRFGDPESLIQYLEQPEGLLSEVYDKVTTKATADKYLQILLGNKDLIRSNWQMMSMRRDLELDIPQPVLCPERVREFFGDLEFNSFLKNWDTVWVPLFF